MSRGSILRDSHGTISTPRVILSVVSLFSANLIIFYLIFMHVLLHLIPIDSGSIVLKEEKEFLVKPDSGGKYIGVSPSSLEDYVNLKVDDRVCYRDLLLIKTIIPCT
jgi:hypothetical protein